MATGPGLLQFIVCLRMRALGEGRKHIRDIRDLLLRKVGEEGLVEGLDLFVKDLFNVSLNNLTLFKPLVLFS